MSNSKNILYLISLILLMLTGCEADSSFAPFPNEGEEPVEVRLHATTLGASVEVSRASDGTIPLPQNTKVGMWGGTYQNLELNYDHNTEALNTTDQSKIYYPLKTDEMHIYTYAPYSTEAYNTEDNTVWVRSLFDEQNANRSHYITDPIWAGDTITKGEAVNGVISASLKFKHVMSRLQIFFVHDRGKTYENIDFSIEFDKVQYGKMSMETGEITPAYSGSEIYKREMGSKTLDSKENTTTPQYDYTVFPGSILKKVYIYNIKDTNGYSDSYEYDFTAEGNRPFPALEAGKIYKMIIDLGKIDGSYNEPSIPEWPNDSWPDDNNDLEF